jgi:hypothetical protein
MIYARINLKDFNFNMIKTQWEILSQPKSSLIHDIYVKYCRHKNFKSVMPIFESELYNSSNDVIGYYDEGTLVAFSLIRRHDSKNAEAIQFAWDYKTPKLRLGIKTLEHECSIYKSLGFEYFYLGEAAEYKKIQGFEILGSI